MCYLLLLVLFVDVGVHFFFLNHLFLCFKNYCIQFSIYVKRRKITNYFRVEFNHTSQIQKFLPFDYDIENVLTTSWRGLSNEVRCRRLRSCTGCAKSVHDQTQEATLSSFSSTGSRHGIVYGYLNMFFPARRFIHV